MPKLALCSGAPSLYMKAADAMPLFRCLLCSRRWWAHQRARVLLWQMRLRLLICLRPRMPVRAALIAFMCNGIITTIHQSNQCSCIHRFNSFCHIIFCTDRSSRCVQRSCTPLLDATFASLQTELRVACRHLKFFFCLIHFYYTRCHWRLLKMKLPGMQCR